MSAARGSMAKESCGEPTEFSLERIAIQALEGALRCMNQAIITAADEGPTPAILAILEYLLETDAADMDAIEALPNNWLSRWLVTRQEAGLDG